MGSCSTGAARRASRRLTRGLGSGSAGVVHAATGIPAEAWTRTRLPGGPHAGRSMVWRRLLRVACLGVGLATLPGPRRLATAPWAEVTDEAVEAVRDEP